MFVAGFWSLSTLGCQAQQVELIQARLVPPALLEPVKSMDTQRRDIRTHWLKIDKQTALFVLDPVVMASLRYQSNEVWTYDFLPDDHWAFDNSQRTVIVQVMPVKSIWDTLAESSIPAKWRPVSKIELRHDGIIGGLMEVNRGPIVSPAGQMYRNEGYFGFEPDWFIQAETVELIVWRGKESTVVVVPKALRLQLEKHFLIFDNVSVDSSPTPYTH